MFNNFQYFGLNTMKARRVRNGLVPVQLVVNEVTASSSQALQAVKVLAQYQGKKIDKVK